MNAEWAAVIITAVGIIGTAMNVWLTSRIYNTILQLKLWCVEQFVKKEELPNFLAPYNIMNQREQIRESEARVRRG